jgi:2',3'-cyclic-nucleotide 2'-phosphodiesterase (5'-nucleotidase family)
MSVAYTLEILHFSDQEASAAALADAPRASAVVSALKAQDLFNDGIEDNTLFLSSGDAYIPSPFFDASANIFAPFNASARGVADILIQNELGVQAIAFGNHEFDLGTPVIRGLILGNTSPNATGTNYPYLSCNLNFTTDSSLNSLQVPSYLPPVPKSITRSVVFTVGNQTIGVVGATTPTINSLASTGGTIAITSAGGVLGLPRVFDQIPNATQIDQLAAIIQTEVNALLAANIGMNKIVLLTHMQQLNIEFSLASRLRNVDIIVAGGSHTRLFDADDRIRAGDSNQGQYPTFITDADNKSTAVVNTDANYKYIGRLVIGFDAAGNIIPSTYNTTVSGAYATDDQGVASLNSTGKAVVNPTIKRITDQLEAAIIATEGNVLGLSSVFLNGQRGNANDPIVTDGVRTQETNLGDLTADANLYYARLTDPNVTVSIKNGGGIRASIGRIVVPPNSTSFVRLSNDELRTSNGTLIKPTNGISQLDVVTALAFNNVLGLVTVTKAELVGLLEFGVAALPTSNGRMCQVAGVSFTFNSSLPALSRIISMNITSVTPQKQIVSNGLIVGDVNETFRVVALDFLISLAGDGYMFPNRSRSLLSIDEGTSSFAAPGSEQDAFAEYLLKFYKTTPYNQTDTDRVGDRRMIDVAFLPRAVPVPVPVPVPVSPPVPANRPTNAPFRANTRAPVSKAPVIKVPSKAPTVAPTKTPTTAPQRSDCGLLGLNVFCPFTFCGLFGRLLGLCD